MTEDTFRSIQSVGRNELIEELLENVPVKADFLEQGPGDDAAVLATDSEDKFQLLSSESFMEGVDFDLTYVPLHHLGYKIASAAVSDIYAMNGKPSVLLVNLSVPNKMSVDMLKEIYRGIGAAAEDYKFQIAGGDLTASHQTLGISVMCYGSVMRNNITYRNGAKLGDAICITGDIGGAIAGLRILMREKQYWEKEDQQGTFKPDLQEYEYVVKRQLVPIARGDVIEQLSELNIRPTSMIDLTQGLVSELKHIARASNVGAYVYQSALPIGLDTRTVADEMKEDVDKYALYGGEDFELMFTLPEEKVKTLADKYSDFTVIGKITEQEEGIRMQQAEGGVAVFDDSNDAD